MKPTILFTVLIAAAFSVNQASGQNLLKKVSTKVQKKVEQKIEDKAVEKIEKEIDKGFDLLEGSKDGETNNSGSSKSDRSQERMMKMMKGMGIAGDPIPIADSYSFDQLIRMNVETFDEKGEKVSGGVFITLTDKNSKNVAYQAISGDLSASGQGVFIIDSENKATIILSEENGKKTGIVYGLGTLLASSPEASETVQIEDTPEYYAAHPHVKKTGNTKKIAGYTCEQFTLSDDDTESELWITRDLKMATNDFFGMIFKVGMASSGMGWGYLMESISVRKNTGEKSVMTVTRVDPNAGTKIHLSDYSITNMGNITIPSE